MSSFRIPRSALRVTFAALALAPLARAADAAPAPVAPRSDIRVPSSEVPDYSAAFEKLFALGLPDSRGGVFVMAENLNEPQGVTEDYPPSPVGFAWRLPTSGTAPRRILVSGLAAFEISKAASGDGKDDQRATEIFASPELYAANSPLPDSLRFRDADLKTELLRTAGRLRAWKMKRERSGKNALPDFPPGRVSDSLLLAAQGWKNGHTQEANQLAHAALSIAPDPLAVTRTAVSALADARWSCVMRDWAQTPQRDQSALAAQLDVILHRYAQGWESAEAAQLLLQKLRAKAPVSDPVLEYHLFTPEQLRFARELLTLRELPPECDPHILNRGDFTINNSQPTIPASSDWMAPACVRAPDGDRQPSPILKFLREQGSEALPLLAALSGDKTLTGCVTPPSPAFSNFGRRGDAGHDRLFDLHKRSLNGLAARPMTRGEIARALLHMARCCLFEITEQRSLEDTVLVDYHTLRRVGITGLLAEKCVGRDHFGRRRVWKTMLGCATTDADFARIEQAMLDEENSLRLMRDFLPTYLRMREGKAAAFLEKFATEVRPKLGALNGEQLARMAQERARQESFSWTNPPPLTPDSALAEFDKEILRLKRFVQAGVKASAEHRLKLLLDDIEDNSSAGLPELEAALEEIVGAHGDPWDKVIPALFERAAKSRRSERQTVLLMLACSAANKASAPGDDASCFSKILPSCRRLLSNTDTSQELRVFWLSLIEQLFLPETPESLRALGRLNRLGHHDHARLLESRFECRATGIPVPPFPSPEAVPPERLDAIIKDLGAAGSSELLRERYSRLSFDEKIAWADALYKDGAAHTPALRRSRRRIIAIVADDPNAKAFIQSQKLSEYAGFDAGAETSRDIFNKVIRNAHPAGILVSLVQQPAGVELRVTTTPLLGATHRTKNSAAEPVILLEFNEQRIGADGQWTPEHMTAEIPQGKASLDTPETKAFWSRVTKQPDENEPLISFDLSIRIPPELAPQSVR